LSNLRGILLGAHNTGVRKKPPCGIGHEWRIDLVLLGTIPFGNMIAQELEVSLRNVTIDWTLRESVRAQLRVLVKRVLRKYGYPPDMQEKATQTVLEQAAVLSQEWAVA
jgi:hypothetical protein